MVGVAAVPGFPVSLAWCGLCLRHGVIPIFCVEATLCDDDLSLYETIDKWGLDIVLSIGADWFYEVYTYVAPALPVVEVEDVMLYGPGRYERIGDYIKRIGQAVRA